MTLGPDTAILARTVAGALGTLAEHYRRVATGACQESPTSRVLREAIAADGRLGEQEREAAFGWAKTCVLVAGGFPMRLAPAITPATLDFAEACEPLQVRAARADKARSFLLGRIAAHEYIEA